MPCLRLDGKVPVKPSSFAEALRRAIDARGLSLERIHDHLARRGVSVSAATLSYWQSGRSQPGRRSSLAAVPHLETVLNLEPGALLGSLPATRERRRRTAVQGLDALWPESPATTVLDRLDTHWDTELDRVTVHDVLRLGRDRRQISLTVSQAMRARTDGPDRRVVMHTQNDTSAGLPDFRAIRGCQLGRVEKVGGVVGAELVFFQPLRRGETVILEYEVLACIPGPLDLEYTRRLRLPIREYLLEVEFDPVALPASIWAFAEDSTSAIELDAGHRAHLVHTNTTPGVTGIRWDWANTSPEVFPGQS